MTATKYDIECVSCGIRARDERLKPKNTMLNNLNLIYPIELTESQLDNRRRSILRSQHGAWVVLKFESTSEERSEWENARAYH
jgi:hypothetical protein